MTLRQFACPHCCQSFELHASLSGLTFACPYCAGTMALPAGESANTQDPTPPPILSARVEPQTIPSTRINPFEPPMVAVPYSNPFEPPVRASQEGPHIESVEPPPRIENASYAWPHLSDNHPDPKGLVPPSASAETSSRDQAQTQTPGYLVRERAQRRLIRTLTLWVFCLIVLLLTLWYFLEHGPQ